ncbi:MAG: aminodeoxychorismate synthase component I [Kiritimatiellae bacterium]|nr:aminodeoxychorismate synthase component I [Kiritimatiellia bacterium]
MFPCNSAGEYCRPLPLAPSLNEARYTANIAKIKERIARGETYQVNYTFPLSGRDGVHPMDRFAALHHAQRSRYSALIETPDFAICSASPELFFRLTGNRIVCQPMKGTAPRGRWAAEDDAFAEQLQNSKKDRAENVMIVDMMRNDLGRIAPAGSVVTTRLFDVEQLPTVWQMTSTVEADTSASLDEMFGALFPCSSITGAPKIQTMRIIRELENDPRGIYTGAIGIVGPNRRAQFSVAIRTLTVNKAGQNVTYNVGSGVIWDSDAEKEYAECLAKSLVLEAGEPFSIFSTLRWESDKGCELWPRHVARLERAARRFGYPFSSEQLQHHFDETAQAFPPDAQRVRIGIHADGRIEIEHQPLPNTNPTRVAIATTPINTTSPFLFHKTTRRSSYEQARAARPDADDVLLWNEAGEITESTIANVAIQAEGHWVTAPIECGLLPGVMRGELLDRGEWIEGRIHRTAIAPGTPIQLANALRGKWVAELIG